MKIRKLFLQAFGPFTQTTLDFTGGAGLHVIYGPNEAGKSSALRAMADLRYGIHPRSKDDFVHPFSDMLVAGCFENGTGQPIGLARRKGNKDTLLLADPETGAPIVGSQIASDVLLALTGGVERAQFDTMYGLDSEHLRRGGQMLIQGEGELGAALFEASTGAAGIKAMLATLSADAKRYYAPRGQSPVLNDAARELDDAKQRYKKAITRPEQWKVLERARKEAQEQLAALRAQLAAQRQRVGQLSELRAVEPLLRELDATAHEWQQVQVHVALAPDARDQRLAAQQQQAHAQADLLDANAALQQCEHELQGLRPEPLLLAHSGAIERLQSDSAQVRRVRDERARLQATVDSEAEQLRSQAQRMGLDASAHSLAALLGQLPSAADQAGAEHALQQVKDAAQDLQRASAQLKALQAQQEAVQKDEQPALSVAHQQALSQALRRAQGLGDAELRLADLRAAAEAEKRKLQRTLQDLGLASVASLAQTSWLASAAIDGYERERTQLLQDMALQQEQLKTLQKDGAVQQRRRASLGVTGEVVTADTLQHARTVREQDWQGVRRALLESAPAASPTALAQTFEYAQTEADRQADLLREGAQRAVQITECEQRIDEMDKEQQALQVSTALCQAALAACEARWTQALTQAGVPGGSAAGVVREWLALRQTALEQQDRLVQGEQAQAALQVQIDAAITPLCAALAVATGHAAPPAQADLAGLVVAGTALDREWVALRSAIERRQQDLAQLAQDMATQTAQVAEQQQRLQTCQGELDGLCQRLWVGAGTSAQGVRAQLLALREWASAYQLHGEHLRQLQALQASAAALAADAAVVGTLLQTPLAEPLEVAVDGLVQRLAQSREASALQEALLRRQSDERSRHDRAQTELATAQQTLAELVSHAQVAQMDALPEAELRSDQRREVAGRLHNLTTQLARTSSQDADGLRAALASQDSTALEQEKQACAVQVEQLEQDEKLAIAAEHAAQHAVAEIDTSDAAAQAREEMEAAVARYRAGVRPWAQLKLAEALLTEALRRHREKAQGPVLALAGEYFRLMTGGRFERLLVDVDSDTPVLLAQPQQGAPVGIPALSEGTADQLHLALRLAALQVQRRPERQMPLVLDDVFMTADDARAAHMFQALEKFAVGGQVLVFTHHQHLADIATRTLPASGVRVHSLAAR